THPFDYDLRLSLSSPDGTKVVLSSNNGASGQDYGTDCTNMTVFSDDAATGIDTAVAPFSGTFKPEQPLGSFIGKNGAAVNGIWNLVIEDQVQGDTGALQCWSLELTPIAPCDGGGSCLFEPAITLNLTNQSASAGDRVQFAITAEGSDPLGYQWFFNQTSLPAETNSILVLTNVTAEQSGIYHVVVSNPYGSVPSSPSIISATFPPPIQITGPSDQTATNGDTVSFTVTATGVAPFSYQWYFNQTNSNPAWTDATLVLNKVTPSQAGTYEV